MQFKKLYQNSVFWFCCTFFWCVIIFFFSAQDATASTAMSDGVLHKIAEICTAWIPADATKINNRESYSSMTFFIRKIAHFTLYFILGLFSSATILSFSTKHHRSLFASWLTAWSFCIFYAATDEFHQLFVPGRTGMLLDIGIDSLGALLSSLLLLFLIQRSIHRNQKLENGV